MIHSRKLPASMAPVIASVFASFGILAACGEPAEPTLTVSEMEVVSEVHALEACSDEQGCEEASTPDAATSDGATSDAATSTPPAPEQGDWGSRCSADDECSIGQCVCGVCTEACNGEPDACAGVPEGAACFTGRSLPRAALCHATTVPGICLQPCSGNEECGEGLVCALGACLPEPESREVTTAQ